MAFTFTQLLTAFLFSILLGLCLGVLYYAFNLIHFFGFNSKLSVFITDLLYMLVCGVITYLFCLVFIEGRVRFFVLIGEGIGFIVYYFTLRRLLAVTIDPFLIFFKKISAKLLKKSQLLLYNIENRVLLIINRVYLYILKVVKYEKRSEKRRSKKESYRRRVSRYKRSRKQKEKAQ